MNAEMAVEEGRAAHNRGDFVEALRLFRIAAEQGDADAQNTVGIMYLNGRGASEDYAEAAKMISSQRGTR